jgi:hypothetical protein
MTRSMASTTRDPQARPALEGEAGPAPSPAATRLATPPPTPYARYMAQAGFRLVSRVPGHGPESDWERQMLLVDAGNDAPRDHAWATARFAIDCMAEHASLFALLLPPELAGAQREQALLLGRQYRRLGQHLDVHGPPPAGELRAFTRQMRDELEPIITFKQECHDQQAAGELRCLAWPLLFDHARREAEHWEDRLGRLGSGDIALEPRETVGFWGHVLDEHARFVAHLLDPAEQRMVQAVLRRGEAFQAATGSLVEEGGTVAPIAEADAVLGLAEEALDFMTETAREVEGARIRSAIVPMLSDHWRRETVWAVDELQRLRA